MSLFEPHFSTIRLSYKIILHVNLEFFIFFNHTFFKNHYNKIYFPNKLAQTNSIYHIKIDKLLFGQNFQLTSFKSIPLVS